MKLLARRTRDGDASDPTSGRPGTVRIPGLPVDLVEALRYLINSREIAGEEPLPQRIALTASIRGEGVTTISRALAHVIASDLGAEVCWIDLSWPTSEPGGSDDAEDAPMGVVDVLSGDVELEDALVEDRLIEDPLADQPTGVTKLAFGRRRADRSISSRSTLLVSIIDELAGRFDHVVFDMPPVLESSSTLPLFRFAEAYLLVIRAGVTRREQVHRTTRHLAEFPLLGTVLNQQRVKIPRVLRRLGTG